MKKEHVEKQPEKTVGKTSRMRKFYWILLLFVAVATLATAGYFFRQKSSSLSDSANDLNMYTVKRGDLVISRLERGDIKPLNSVDIKSEVEGRTTIIKIVDEGTYITPEDVNDGMVLVELDSSEIKQKLTRQKIDFLNAEASFTDAGESLDIRKKQNESDIKRGKLSCKFSTMDFKKYIGKSIAEKIIADANQLSGAGITLFLDSPDLGGSALQTLKQLDDSITLSESKLERAKYKLQWTQRLYDEKYVAQTQLKADKLDVQSLNVQKEEAEIALELFKSYDFPKEVEKLFSDHQEAKRELQRIEAGARSKLVQAQAKLRSNEATYLLQKERLAKYEKQFEACTIKAPVAGQVTYYQGGNQWSRETVAVGEMVRERQKIICIPGSSQMKVEVKVHETWIDKIALDQPADIIVAAFPEKKFTGKVLKKAPLADLENWMNPDLKVYSTDVGIDGTHDFIKTGMTAKVEIIIKELKDVIKIPIQAVASRNDKKVCYVIRGKKTEQREIAIGEFNNNFIEIKKGLSEGEKILLNPPRFMESESEKE